MANPGWGVWGKCPLPPHLVEEPAILLIKIATKLCQANESMHILLTNSPEIKANQSQFSCEIVIQHLCAY